jgi:hypothetical protein
MSVYSARTGRPVRALASFSPRVFTNNGLAYAPDGSAVYYTLIARRPARPFVLHLMRLNTATGRRTFVADGAQPALSIDGKQLAYGAFPQGVAVRDLQTGKTRTLALKELGKAANLLDASIHWLGDGADVAIVPTQTPWDLVGKPPKLYWCGEAQNHPVVVFVHVPPPPAPMTARCVHLSGRAIGVAALGSTQAFPSTLLLASASGGVERVTESGAVTPVLAIPDSLPMSFDPSGTHLLYLAGHTPPRLTEANIANGRLSPGPWLNRLNLGAVAW